MWRSAACKSSQASVLMTVRPLRYAVISTFRTLPRFLWQGCCTCSLRVIPAVQKTRYNAPFTIFVRGLCHGIPSRFLPARADRSGVGVPDALWAVAIGACCSSPNASQAPDAPGQALQKTHAFSGSHPETLLHCL